MPNRWDLRRLLSGVVLVVMALPYVLCVYAGTALTALAKGMEVGRWKVHRWANPEVYGDAPPRARKLFYRRKTVERMAGQIESLKRIIDRQGSAP
jgi:hypothetical protein